MFTINYKDPFTNLPHLISAEEIIVKQGDTEHDFILSAYVPCAKMFMNATIHGRGALDVILRHLYEDNKVNIYENQCTIEVVFKQEQPKQKDIELYAVNLDSLLGPDYSDNGYEDELGIDLSPYFDLFDFGPDDEDIDTGQNDP